MVISNEVLKNALKDDREVTYSWLDLGALYFHKGKYNKALKAYKEFLKIESDEAIIWVYRGIISIKIGKYGKAKKAFKKMAKNRKIVEGEFIIQNAKTKKLYRMYGVCNKKNQKGGNTNNDEKNEDVQCAIM